VVYVTNLTACPGGSPVTPELVISSYGRLFEIEELPHVQARPAGQARHHRKPDSIEAHLAIVFAALSVSRWIEARTGRSIRKFVRTARRYRTIQVQAGQHTLIAEDPLPADLRQALDHIRHPNDTH